MNTFFSKFYMTVLILVTFVTQAYAVSEDDIVDATTKAVSTGASHELIKLIDARIECSAFDHCQHPAEIIAQTLDLLALEGNKEIRTSTIEILRDLISLNLPTEIQFSLLKVGLEQFPEEFKTYTASIARSAWSEELSLPLALRLYSIRTHLPESYRFLIKEIKARYSKEFQTLKKSRRPVTRYELAKDLLISNPPIEKYASGAYAGKPRLYMFCRQDRRFPCLMVMRKIDGQLLKTPTGEIWTHKSLGYSRHKKSFNQTNGNTPSGIFRIDGVMEHADDQLVFGKNRRLILNFVGASANEERQKFLLPESSHDKIWWREAVVARDIGRGLFRVHGTGLRSSSGQPFYPFVPTSGCIAQRENRYKEVDYNDQRLLLDELMQASNLAPVFSNEQSIKSLIYVINIDSEEAPVELTTLRKHGIVP